MSALLDVRPACRALHVPAGSLVVVAGLPGAGKTTLVRRLSGTRGVRALDAEDVARRAARLPVPYRVVRPLVHGLHVLRVVVAAWGGAPCLLTSDPMTSPLRRRLLRAAARLSGRRLHVLVVHASAGEAREGQRQRGRALGARRMARHVQRYDALLAAHPAAPRLTRAQAAGAVLVVR